MGSKKDGAGVRPEIGLSSTHRLLAICLTQGSVYVNNFEVKEDAINTVIFTLW